MASEAGPSVAWRALPGYAGVAGLAGVAGVVWGVLYVCGVCCGGHLLFGSKEPLAMRPQTIRLLDARARDSTATRVWHC